MHVCAGWSWLTWFAAEEKTGLHIIQVMLLGWSVAVRKKQDNILKRCWFLVAVYCCKNERKLRKKISKNNQENSK